MAHRHAAGVGAAAATGLALLAACGGAVERSLGAPRVVAFVGDERPWGASTAERFGLSAASLAGAQTRGGALAWSTPPGWTERPPSALRQGDWSLPGGAECSLTLLPGGGGGLEANVQRWRQQLSLPPATPAELAALPHARLLGADALLLELEGTWVGMGGGAPQEGWALLGLLSVDGGEARFLKLVGPAARVAAERDAFLALGASIRRGAREGSAVPSVLQGASDAPAEGPPPALQRAAGLAWSVPEGWSEAPARPFRVVTFQSAEHPGLECFITLLAGDGGGLEANVERWRGQVGGEGAPADVVERRELTLLGGPGTLVALQARGPGAGALLGALRRLDGRALFVKLTGPQEALDAERERFLALCASLREEAR